MSSHVSQTYTCSSDGTSWGSAVPAAILFDHGFKIATHYAGPTWQAIDGSLVMGTKRAGSNTVSVLDTTTNSVLTTIPVGSYP